MRCYRQGWGLLAALLALTLVVPARALQPLGDLAGTRDESGVARQLAVVQAQRDAFAAAVAQAQADFEPQYSRARLRLSARRTGAGRGTQ